MKRLSFVLPDFTRIAWVSDNTREIWMPRIQRISQAFREIEWQSILSGVRACSLTSVSPNFISEYTLKLSNNGLATLLLEKEGISSYIYSAKVISVQPGKPFNFRIVSGKIKDVALFKEAWDDNDHEQIGNLLGYPNCCIEFFRKVWINQKFVDTTWHMASASKAQYKNATEIEILGNTYTNILWRWMGVRPVPHLPCSFDCDDTANLAKALISVGRTYGFTTEMDWLQQILSWPVNWSALHGIAEIKSPILKISTRTDATAEEYTVRFIGDSYPEIGAKGLNYPYQQSKSKVIVGHNKVNQSEFLVDYEEWCHMDNGFSSLEAMEAAHQPIIKLALSIIGENPAKIVDLGCGNGALLKKLTRINGNIIPYGIDCNSARIQHARKLHPEFVDNFIIGDMFECDSAWSEKHRFSIAILMVGRLLEVNGCRHRMLRKFLTERVNYILVYAYGDWLNGVEGLKGLAKKGGLVLLSEEFKGTAGLTKFK